jgi:hypothetical protein
MKRTFATLTLLALALCQVAAVPASAAVPKSAAPKAAASQGDGIAKAKAFFQRYVALEHAFDLAMVNLYSDSVVIKNKRYMPDGKIVPMTVPASRFKKALKDYMPKARQVGDISTYTNDTYTMEGNRVRINVIRYSSVEKVSSPVSILVGPDPSGKWLIFEEVSESHLKR